MKIELDPTEEKIVNATFNILQKEGVTKATTKKIAKEAGVNEVTIFRKFDSKKNLVEVTKNYHIQLFMEKLEEIFDFRDNEEIEEYLQISFFGLLSLSDNEFSVLKVALEEVREIPEKKLLISQVTDAILEKNEEFFKMQIEQGKIREVDPRVLGAICFSVLFQSIVFWKVYNVSQDLETNNYNEKFLDILFNGIKSK
ncbi:TetR/AcrR family transcriptional regulator [Methanobrevibacter sp.]|uniref:TetR/AcrR family transcriptional regulator n=1 Tax=Methanobrevibacter sp. TaxID=66852 RepID=UPI0025CD4512|nr:TetR/AcrR family transcriptional regulator [Methanobrevibacter sp.]MBQ2962887.1 TetR/AcrR family transcriptional regulator [Methanobrevibacter sp.]